MTTITTFTGKEVDPFALDDKDIEIEDIAHALALLCRFNGHCREFYSVAEHSVWVSENCLSEQALAGLLHDAAEAYLGDIPTPIKDQLPEFKKAEERAEAVIARVFGLAAAPDVKSVDTLAFEIEKAQLFVGPGDAAQNGLACLSWRKAEESFLRRFRELQAG